MNLEKKIIVLYNEVKDKASKDEIDVIYQVNAVSKVLEQLGFTVHKQPFSHKIEKTLEVLENIKPLLVFNLVETVSEQGKLSYLAPSILESLNIKYTGCPAEAIFLTTNKIVGKKLLEFSGIKTPEWINVCHEVGFTKGDKYIIKAIYEDGSVELYQHSIVTVDSVEEIKEILKLREQKTNKEFFAEKYIEGREIHISLIEKDGMPLVLSPLEIKFKGYKERNIEEIYDYSAKWEENSFQYKNAILSTKFHKKDSLLLKELERIAVECWQVFRLKGYARVDFRIDKEGRPWVLEINANPCITPGDTGFLNSAAEKGLSFREVVERIVTEV